MNHNHLPAWNASLISNTGSTRSITWAPDDGTAQPSYVPQQAVVISHEHASQPTFLPPPNSHEITSSMSEAPSINASLIPASAACKKPKCPYCITEFTHLHDSNSPVVLRSQKESYGCAESQLSFHESKQHSSLHTIETSHDPSERCRRLESEMKLAQPGRTGSREALLEFLEGSPLQRDEIETRLSAKRTKKSSGLTVGLACPFPTTKSSCQVMHNYFSHVCQHLRRDHRFKLGCKRKGRSKWLALYDVHDHSARSWGPILCLGCRKSLDDRYSWYDHDERWCVRSQANLHVVWNAVYVAFNDTLNEQHGNTQRHYPLANQDPIGILTEMHSSSHLTQIRSQCNICSQQNPSCNWASDYVSSCIRCTENSLLCEPRTQQESGNPPVKDAQKRKLSIAGFTSQTAQTATETPSDYTSNISPGQHDRVFLSSNLWIDNSPGQEILPEPKPRQDSLTYDILCPLSPSSSSTQELSAQMDRQYIFLDGTSPSTFGKANLPPPPPANPKRTVEEKEADSGPIKNERDRLMTFSNRKREIFRKAHELSVLCSTEVTICIHGHGANHKLYEYSSSNTPSQVKIKEAQGTYREIKGPQDYDDDKNSDGDAGDDAFSQKLFSYMAQSRGLGM